MRVTIITHIDVGKAQQLGDRYSPRARAVEVGPDAYIGANAVILPGVKIGAGTVVGASALVNRDVKPGTVVAGVPVRPLNR